MSITTEQLAELKAALEKATKGEWRYRPHEFDDWGYIRSWQEGGDFESIVAISRAGREADLHAHRAAKTDPYEPNGRFITLAHNLLPSLIAAAEEAGRLRAERDSAFAAGRKEGLEKAAKVALDNLSDEVGQEIASAIRLLLDAPSEEPAGEGAAAEIERLTKERDDALSENRLIAHYKKHRDEVIAAYQSVRAKLDRAERVKRDNAVMRKALAAFDMVTHAHKVEITEKASGASVVLSDGEISGIIAALALIDAPAAPEAAALAEARETIMKEMGDGRH